MSATGNTIFQSYIFSQKFNALWVAVIVLTFLASLFINIIARNSILVHSTLHLFYIPVILACLRFKWHGFVFSLAVIFIYSMVIIFVAEAENVYWITLSRVPFILLVSLTISWLSWKANKSAQKLEEEEQNIQHITEYTYNWEYWLSPDHKLKYMSPACKRITGYTAREFSEDIHLLEKIIHPYDRKKWANHRCFASKTVVETRDTETELRIVTRDGRTRWMGHVCRKLHDYNGNYIGLRVSNRDITRQIEAERKFVEISIESEKKERNVFAAQVHDRLGPLLSTIKLYFQWLSETDNIEKTKIITEKGNNSIEVAIDTLRQISHSIGSYVLDNEGLSKAMKDLIRQINATQKIRVKFQCENIDHIDKIKQTTLYYTALEMINNSLKHAEAQNIFINIKLVDIEKNLQMVYKDDGKGFDQNEINTPLKQRKGMGLENISQRVKALRGSIDIQTKAGHGFTAVIQLPYHDTVISDNYPIKP